MPVSTKHPVVLIHGAFGYGRDHPLWNYAAPYWPEQTLRDLNDNHCIVSLGIIASDHDRACETFYQLHGGTVDYGAEHAKSCGHLRYGVHYATPLHPLWSSANPVHLIGHSMGATAALELYQLLCRDFFNVGSDASWVRSIVSIAGPLTGSLLPHLCGLHSKEIPPISFAHAFAAACGSWHKLYRRLPLLRGLYDLRMDQWDNWCLKDLASTEIGVRSNGDFAVFDILPAFRINRNKQLSHMHKLYLLSITTSPQYAHIPIVEALVVLALVGSGTFKFPRRLSTRLTVITMLSLFLYRRLRHLDFAKIPTMHGLALLMQRCAKSLHLIFDGFKPDEWVHNDGAVNIQSMLRPWLPKPSDLPQALKPTRNQAILTDEPNGEIPPSASNSSLEENEMARHASHISIDAMHAMDDTQRFIKGRWHVYRVDGNHLTGTHWDAGAKDLYKRLFMMIRQEYEDPMQSTTNASHSLSDRGKSDNKLLDSKSDEAVVNDAFEAAAENVSNFDVSTELGPSLLEVLTLREPPPAPVEAVQADLAKSTTSLALSNEQVDASSPSDPEATFSEGISRSVVLARLGNGNDDYSRKIQEYFGKLMAIVEFEVTGMALQIENYVVMFLESTSEQFIQICHQLQTQKVMDGGLIKVLASSENNPGRIVQGFYVRKLAITNRSEANEVTDDNVRTQAVETFLNLIKFVKKIGPMMPNDVRRSLTNLSNTDQTFLPSPDIIKKLMGRDELMSLKEYLHIFDAPIDLEFESERVWPIRPLIHY